MSGKDLARVKKCEYCNIQFETTYTGRKICNSCVADKIIKCPCCKKFNKPFTSSMGFINMCEECFYNVIVPNTHSIYNDNNKDEWIECQYCTFRCKELCPHLKHIHNTKAKEYTEKFIGHKTKSKNICDSVRGSNNPGYQHGGKLSPWSYNSLYHTKEEVLESRALALENCKLPDKNSTRIEYWLKKGFSELDSKIKIKERQTTFSKEICIEKYGQVEGLKIWKDRQDRWQATLNAKTDDEKLRINKAKQDRYTDISNSISKAELEIFDIICSHGI